MSGATRRSFIQTSLATGIASTILPELNASDKTDEKPHRETVRVGFVGIGVKGWQHVRNLLHVDGVEMRAVCDILTEPCVRTQRACRELGMPEPTAYTGGEYEFKRMCDQEDLDLVYTATPWRWHVPVCLAALQSGKHAATEIPAAITLEDCWRLVETCESTGKHLSMMENVNYRRDELAILRMVREGALGELIHAEVGYAHDTRYLKIRDYGDGLWLGAHHAERNGNLYPTHGLGPIAWNMNLQRGNRMEYLVSMSSKARGMNLYAKEHLPKDHPYRKRDYINGDVNTSLVHTANGETIVIKHDTDLPRPYSRTNLVQGTRGIVRGFPEFQVSLEQHDLRPGKHLSYKWRPGGEYYEKYDHPLWKHISSIADETPKAADGFQLSDEIRSGDYLEDYRLIQAIRKGIAPDFDVYDAASWSAVTALSEASVSNRSQAVDFPDFTRGKWKTREPLKLMGV
ncbi:MAG: Gfo/Idh/MocA family protein [Rubripirellula sp.]